MFASRDIYINMNNDKSELYDMFDVIFVDSFVLCHVKDIVNFYELVMSLIKGTLLKKNETLKLLMIYSKKTK